MDIFVSNLPNSSFLLKDSLLILIRLRDLSRSQVLLERENFKKICSWYNEIKNSEQLDLLGATIANVLLQNRELMNHATKNDIVIDTLIKKVQDILYINEKNLALWRILFLLAYGKCYQKLDRNLIMKSLKKIIEELPNDSLVPISLELSKYWYALCYNYGYTKCNAKKYAEIFNSLNYKLQNCLIPKYLDLLIQLGSIYLLIYEHGLSITNVTLINFFKIFNHMVKEWSCKVEKELYCSTSDYKLPQLVQILHLFIGTVGEIELKDISSSIINPNINSIYPSIGKSLIKLLKSPISNLYESVSSILNLMNLEYDKLRQEIVEIDLVVQPVNSSGTSSSNSFKDKILHNSFKDKFLHNTSLIFKKDGLNIEYDIDEPSETWSEKDKIEEAQRVMAAIDRLNELGVMKTIYS